MLDGIVNYRYVILEFYSLMLFNKHSQIYLEEQIEKPWECMLYIIGKMFWHVL